MYKNSRYTGHTHQPNNNCTDQMNLAFCMRFGSHINRWSAQLKNQYILHIGCCCLLNIYGNLLHRKYGNDLLHLCVPGLLDRHIFHLKLWHLDRHIDSSNDRYQHSMKHTQLYSKVRIFHFYWAFRKIIGKYTTHSLFWCYDHLHSCCRNYCCYRFHSQQHCRWQLKIK